MYPLFELKQYQKDLAQAIKLSKDDNGKSEFEFCKKYGLKFIPNNMSYEFRHNHIAYCELRGRLREQIEKPGENNLPNEYYITEIKTLWMGKINEALRSCTD